jgi:hypothetical protein
MLNEWRERETDRCIERHRERKGERKRKRKENKHLDCKNNP